MNTQELLELARLVYPPTKSENWCIDDYTNHVVQSYKTHSYGWVIGNGTKRFNPSLTGEDWQQAQACRVIVAAAVISHGRFVINGPAVFDENGEGDILATAIAALLSGEGRG